MCYYSCHQVEIPSILLLLYKCTLLIGIQRKQVALMILAYLKKKKNISSALTCMYPCHGSVPFASVYFQRTCSVHVNTHAGSSAQKGERMCTSTGKGCFWSTNSLSYSLLGTWQSSATPDWSVFAREVLPQCLNVRLTSTLHRYLDYDHKNNATYLHVWVCA